MATATFRAPTMGAPIMGNNIPNLTPKLVEIVRQIRALKAVQKKSGFRTDNTIIEIMKELSRPELVAVGEALQLHPHDLNHYLSRL